MAAVTDGAVRKAKGPRFYDSPRCSAEVADCSMPVTFDQYSVCGYFCLYCFSQFSRGVGKCKAKYWSHEAVPVNVDRVMRLWLDPTTDYRFTEFIKARKVLQWGGLSDPFCPFEKRYGVGLELLRFWNDLDYPICFSTKGTWWLDDERYTELFRGRDNWNMKISLVTADADLARKIEKGCPSPAERIRAMEKYAKLNNGGVTLRLRPFIPGISDATYEQLIRDAASAGATALSTEFFCIEERSPGGRLHFHELSKLAGFDLYAFYKRYSAMRGYMRLNRNVKRPIIDRMEELCDQVGLRFYVSDAHFKERCANGSCCGLPPTWNYSRGQFTEAITLARKNGSVRWSEFEKDARLIKNIRARVLNWGTVEGASKIWHMSMYDLLHWLWNNPNRGRSPYRYFEGVIQPDGTKDENGDLIYYWHPERA